MGLFYVNVWVYDLAKSLFLDTLLCHGLVSATIAKTHFGSFAALNFL